MHICIHISSVTLLCPTLCNPMDCSHQARLSFTVSQSLLQFMSIESLKLSISSSVTPFPSCPQSLPASRSFQMSRLFTSGGQRFGASASASVLPMNIQDWFPLGKTGLISLQSKGLSGVLSSSTVLLHRIKQGFLLLILHPFQWTSALRIFPVCFIHELNN